MTQRGKVVLLLSASEEVRVWRSRDDGRPALVRLDDDARDELVGSMRFRVFKYRPHDEDQA